jgi:hypothetical protein
MRFFPPSFKIAHAFGVMLSPYSYSFPGLYLLRSIDIFLYAIADLPCKDSVEKSFAWISPGDVLSPFSKRPQREGRK